MTNEAELSNRSVGRAAIWATLANSVGQGLSLIMFLVMSRFVSPEDYGAVAIALILVEVCRQFGVDPPALAVLSKAEPTDRDFSTCFFMVMSYAIVVGIGLYLSAEGIAWLLGRPTVADALQPISIMLVLIALWRSHEAWLTRRMLFRALFFRMLAASFLGGAVGITLGVMDYGMWALVAQQLTFASVSVIAVWSASNWRPRFGLIWKDLMEILRFSRPIAIGGAFNLLGKQSDVVICGYFLGLERAGVYNGAKRLNLALQLMLNEALKQVALPSLARVSGDDAQMRAAFVKSLSMVSFIAVPIYLGVSAVSVDLVSLLFGEKWVDVGPILAIVAIASLFHAMEELIVMTFLAKDRPKWMMYFNSVSAITNIVVIAIAAPFGLETMAWAYTLRVMLFFPVVLGAALRLLEVSMWRGVGAMFGSLVAGAAMWVMVWALQQHLVDWHVALRLPTLILAGVVGYVTFSVLVNRAVFAEARSILRQVAARAETAA